MKRNWGGNYENVAILVAMGVTEGGQREVIGATEGMKEDKESWRNFLVSLKERGLTGTRLFIGDKCLGLLDAINTVFPKSKYQRCTVHFYRNVFSVVPRGKVKEVAAMLKAIHAQEDKAADQEKLKFDSKTVIACKYRFFRATPTEINEPSLRCKLSQSFATA